MKFDPSLPTDGANVSHTHPLREACLLVAGVVGAVVALVVVVAVVVDLAVPHLPPGLETRLFSGLDFGRAGDEVAQADPRTAALQDLLDRLAARWNDHRYEFRVGIWEADEPNALAFPGGRIAVTWGLLEGAESENELAFVLGHELGHYRNRDHLRGLGRALTVSLVMTALSAGGGGGASQLVALAADLTQRSYDRDQEQDADAFALALVFAEYGHVGGATDFFEHLPHPHGEVDEQIATYLSTHPLHEDRIEALRELAREERWPARDDLVPFLSAGDS